MTRRKRVAKVIRTNKKGVRRIIIEGRGKTRKMKRHLSLTVLTKNSVLATGGTPNATRS